MKIVILFNKLLDIVWFESLVNLCYCVQLSVRGYYDKQTVLVQKIMDKLVNFKVDPKRFEILKDTVSWAVLNSIVRYLTLMSNFLNM